MGSLSGEAAAIFERERARLLSALGAVTSGGVVERVEPVGSRSVPGLNATGGLDLALAIWPFPVDEKLLTGLGYRPLPGESSEDLQRFENASGQVQLWLANTESGFFDQALLARDYLRASPSARQAFNARQDEKSAFFERIRPEAERWWVEQQGFGPLEAVTGELAGATFPWYIASGWAVDLSLGRVTRVHRDVDVVVPFNHQAALQELLLARGWTLLTPLEGRLEPWPRHMLLQLPRHQAHARRGDVLIDVLLTEIEHGVWHYRRDPLIVRSTDRMALTSAGGIPYLAPELVLLFKSRNTGRRPRPQDQADFEQVLPLLEPERRAWLRWAITAGDASHPWLERLGT